MTAQLAQFPLRWRDVERFNQCTALRDQEFGRTRHDPPPHARPVLRINNGSRYETLETYQQQQAQEYIAEAGE